VRPSIFHLAGTLAMNSIMFGSRYGRRISTEFAIATRSPCDESK